MSKKESFDIGSPCFGYAKGYQKAKEVYNDDNLLRAFNIAIISRRGKKICRNCYCRLPISSKVCRKCHNSDLRFKEKISPTYYDKKFSNNKAILLMNKNTRNKMINNLD